VPELLCVAAVTRSFGALTVLDRVGFELSAGECAAVTGPNGAGKSTLLRCVTGADRPDAGSITLDGKVVDESSAEIRAAMACALDDVDYFPDLSVAEHLRLCAAAHGATLPGDLVDRTLVEVGLERARDQLPVTLSSGQRRRLSLAACFVRPRRLLVFDEPDQHLDGGGKQWLSTVLQEEKERGTAVLFASHDEEFVSGVADRRVDVTGDD